MNPKILVTGATGTIGSYIVSQLFEQKANFVALVRSEEKAKLLREAGVETAIGDFSEPEGLEKALKGVTTVFLLSVTSPEAPALQGNLIDAAKKMGVQHIVKVSSLGTSLDSPIGIARYHGAIEAQLKASGMAYTFLHPHSFMQNLIFDSGTIRENDTIYAQMGDGKIAMVDARDIASVAVKALTEKGHENKTYVLTGPGSVSYHEIAEIFSQRLGRKINYVPVTSVNSRSSMLEAGMPDWLVEDIVELNIGFSQGEGDIVSPDVEHIIGRKGYSVDDFVHDNLHLFS